MNRGNRLRAVVLVIALVSAGGVWGPTAEAQKEQTFTGTIRACVIHNPTGAVEVGVWEKEEVEVVAVRADGGVVREGAVLSEKAADGELTLWVNAAAGEALTLRMRAPASARVTVRGGTGEVTVRGVFNGISAETTTGAIRMYAEAKAAADVSMRSRRGAVRTDVKLEMQGTPEGGFIEGRLNGGGVPVMLRSLSGMIELLPMNAAARAGGAPTASLDPRQGRNMRQILRGTLPSGGIAIGNAGGNPGGLAELKKSRAKTIETTGARFRAQSRLVLMSVSAVDGAARRIADLQKEEFKIVENGAEQAIAVFEPVSAPLQIFLLLDLSGSAESKEKIVREASKKFVEALQPQDQVAVAGFTSQFLLASEFTSDRKLLKQRIGDIRNRSGGTYFYKALWHAMDMTAEAAGTRKAIVVMSDGVDNALGSGRDPAVGEADFQILKERLGSEDITVFPVYLNTEYEMVVKKGAPSGEDSLSYKKAREQLQEIATLTGGEVFRAERVEDLAAAFAQVVTALRSFYTLGYYPPRCEGDSGEWREVKVQVGREGVKARARSGYFVP